jgi:4-hydroxythreonine-4-phosphate dehydrogenase
MKKKIIIITGEPISINTEIIYKSWKKINKNLKKNIYFISNFKLLSDQFKYLKYNIKVKKVKSLSHCENDSFLKVIDVDLKYKNFLKLPLKEVDKFIIKSLDLAHEMALKKNVKGIINCPISKSHLNKKFYGATEYFASKCSINDNSEVMLIRAKELAVTPITTHTDVKNIVRKINIKLIMKKIITINSSFKRLFKKKPKIAVLGLNPHNAEFKKNSEENRIIVPSIKKLKKMNINLNGPFAADTLFVKKYKDYNVVVGMFHDQVIAPFKTLYKFNAINITLGLKYLRISPDHGTAADLFRKNKANPASLIDCINFINKYGK